MPPSLDVRALQLTEELAPQSTRWVLPVDVPVPEFPEVVHEIQEVQVVELLGGREGTQCDTPVSMLEMQEFVNAGMNSRCTRHDRS